ncbi:glycosyltransferase family 8 protein [Mannheimia sp. HC-2023]|uniref:glycosyltransferase family 8 protein n=1 Tax=Mannheimia indoligenes TaxID=3103145 RepID=UPI002FE5E006
MYQPTNQPMVIALAADLGYQTQVETLIKSLCYHHSHLKIYLFQKTFPDEWFDLWCNKLILLSSEIIPVKVNMDFSKFKTLDHINETGFFRYLIPYLEDERVLYLDSDIVVDGNLAEMYWQDFNNVPLFAVEDYVLNHRSLYSNFDIKPYFNSGVLLINNSLLDSRIIDLLIEVNEKFPDFESGDQDALNLVFKDCWGRLPLEYNYQTDAIVHYIYREDKKSFAKERGFLDIKPKIIHYTSHCKPWRNDFTQLMREKYWFYYGLEWKDILLRHPR